MTQFAALEFDNRDWEPHDYRRAQMTPPDGDAWAFDHDPSDERECAYEPERMP